VKSYATVKCGKTIGIKMEDRNNPKFTLEKRTKKEHWKYCEVMYIIDDYGNKQAVRTCNSKGFMNAIMNEVYKVPIGERDKAMEEIYIKLAYIIDYIDPKWYAKHKIDPEYDIFSKEYQEKHKDCLIKKVKKQNASQNNLKNVKRRKNT
jgi:hypothetical protein